MQLLLSTAWSLQLASNIVSAWSRSNLYLTFAFKTWNSDSFLIFFEEFISSWAWCLSLARKSSLACSNLDFCRSLCLIAEVVGARTRADRSIVFISLRLADLRSRNRSFGSYFITPRSRYVSSLIFFVELLSNNAALKPRERCISYLVLPWARPLV